MMTLALYRGGTLVQNVAMDGRNLRIGRLPENDLVLADDGKAISKVHAELRMEKGVYVVHDLGSTNGTWMDGKRITRAALTVGRDVVIGPYRLVLSDDGADASTPPTLAEHDHDSGDPEISTGRHSRAFAAQLPKGGPAGGWPGRHAKALIFGGTVAMLVLIVGVAVWQQSPAQTQQATAPPEPTIQLPPLEPPPTVLDPHVTNINAATSMIESAERGVKEGAFSEAIAQFKQALSDHLAPVLEVDPNHGTASGLKERADAGIASAEGLQAQAKTERKPKGPTPAEIYKILQATNPLPQRPDESQEEWIKRNGRAAADYQAGLAQLKDGDCLDAKKTFSDLSKREPSLNDPRQRLQEATERCHTLGQAAIAQGSQKEDARDWVGAATDFATAKRYEHPDADQRIDANLNQRRKVAGEAIKEAKQYANRGLYSEAIKQYEQVTRLLPASDKDHEFALSQMAELKRRQ